jgi:glycosyltransferase involved in cell wall biosynthesis
VFYRNFLPELARVKNGHEVLVLVRLEQRDVIAAVPPEFQTVALEGAPSNFLARFVWEQVVLPRWLRENRIDVLYAQQTTALFAQCKRVLSITGANPYSALDFDFNVVDRVKHHAVRLVGKVSARVADRVLFISENSRSLIAPRLKSERKTTVVPYGVRLPEERLMVQCDDDFILTVSVLWPHKNYERLMHGFDLLVRQGYSGRLIIAGAAHDTRYATRLYTYRDNLRCRQQIVFTDRLSAEQLDELYRRARMFVFPSLEETQGLPLLEAMSYGLPIAASDCSLSPQGQQCFSPFREFAGDAAIYFDPFKPEAIAAAMSSLLNDPAGCVELGVRGRERAAEFSWRRTAEETLRVFAGLSVHA